ncbi:alpha/beta fold hydrolase [Microbacterium sp. CPCC 204701]|uniref:alpha/beta fold hydrolase n=1 Tax=Microbacterium sp. CPCC 204701 TaxID=2493084 RepID=UPI000FD70666|nr:alpha/beta hydrolase [Microbacterium sp. CPCC 204701]
MTVPEIALASPSTGSGVGSEARPLLVLGPSLGTSTILWENVMPALDGYRVLAWDLPGHGASPRATEPFTMAEVADAVAEAVGEPFLYAGVSFGGCVGLELLLRHAEQVLGAAIVASGAHIGEPQAWHERAAQVRAQSTSALIVGSAQRWFAPASIERSPGITGRLLHALQDADDESYALCCEALARFDARDRLGEITRPVLAVWGAYDGVTPEASAREIADGVRDGRSAGIDGAAHLPPADDAASTAAVLREFFDHVVKEKTDAAS